MLAEVPAAAKMATAKAAHVAAAKAAKVTTGKAAWVAAAKAADVAASKAVAEVSVRELSAISVEAKMATVEAGAKAKAAVIRPVVAVVPVVGIVAVVASAVSPGVGIVAGIRITGRDSANHSGRDGGAGIVAVSVAASVSPNVMVMACVAMCDVLVHAMRDRRVSDPRVSGMLIMAGMLIMTSDSRRIRGGKRRRQHQSGRAKREGRNSKSAKSHGDIPFRLATQQRRENVLCSPQIDCRYSRTRSKTITISRVLHCLSCRNRKPQRSHLN